LLYLIQYLVYHLLLCYLCEENKNSLAGVLGHCREAAETQFLAGAGLKVAVTAFANQNRRLVRLFDPMAVLLESFGRTFGLDVFTGGLGLILSLILGLLRCHSGA